PAAASRPSAPPPLPSAAGSPDSRRAPAAARASPARGPALLRPPGGPEENPEPALPSPTACEFERSYALSFWPRRRRRVRGRWTSADNPTLGIICARRFVLGKKMLVSTFEDRKNRIQRLSSKSRVVARQKTVLRIHVGMS